MSEAGPGSSGNGAPGVAVTAAPRLLNVANALTVARLLLVPVCVGFLAAGGTGYRYIAFAAFAVASMTDLADGELARRRNLITDFGKIADPIADKALTGSALITLSALGDLAWWITIVIVARELAVTALRFWVIRRGVIAASRGGKIKTMLQVIAISLYILPWAVPVEREVLMGAAVAVTLATGIDYTVRAIQLHRAVPHGLASASPLSAASPAARCRRTWARPRGRIRRIQLSAIQRQAKQILLRRRPPGTHPAARPGRAAAGGARHDGSRPPHRGAGRRRDRALDRSG